jgi:hypothetical protein
VYLLDEIIFYFMSQNSVTEAKYIVQKYAENIEYYQKFGTPLEKAIIRIVLDATNETAGEF